MDLEKSDLLSNDNPEKTMTKQDLFEKLSIEARFVLYAIFNTPGELSTLLFDRKNSKLKNDAQIPIRLQKTKINKDLIKKYLKLIGWKTKDINITIFEIKEFTKALSQL